MKTLPKPRPETGLESLSPADRRKRIAALVLAAVSVFGFALKLLFFP